MSWKRRLLEELKHLIADDAAEATVTATARTARPHPAPVTIRRADPAVKVLDARAKQVLQQTRMKPSGANPALDTSIAAHRRTTERVPQSSRQVAQAELPRISRFEKHPAGDRIRPILDYRDELAELMAGRIGGMTNSAPDLFYHNGPLYEGLEKQGFSPSEADDFVQKRFAPLYAGTSPRTATDQNLRNASLLHYLDANGYPLHEARDASNLTGYPMMDMHYDLSDKLLRGEDIRGTNTKPTEFQHAVAGDLGRVVGDTHFMRGTLGLLEELTGKGSIPEGFILPHARDKYRDTGELNFAGDIDDQFKVQTRGGQKRQVEYGPFADIAFDASDLLGIHPSQVQSRMWFRMGDKTGLRSEEKTLPDLLNDQLDITGQTLGIEPGEVLKLWATGKIPLMAEGGLVS